MRAIAAGYALAPGNQPRSKPLSRQSSQRSSSRGTDRTRCESEDLERSDAASTASSADEPFHVATDALDEDTYGMGITALVKDTYWLHQGNGKVAARVVQLIASLFLQTFTLVLQAFLIYELQELVSSRAVHHGRNVYTAYETHMYRGRTKEIGLGQRRGLDSYWDPEQFVSLDGGLKDEVCAMPLSQPGFFGAVLLIWTLTVANNLKRTLELTTRLLWNTPTVPNVGGMLQSLDGDELLVKGLTRPIKILILFMVTVPRILMNVVLLWRGSRWLGSTMDYADMLLNAIALEFILLLKDLLYVVIISDRNKHEVQAMRLLPRADIQHADAWKYLETYSWLLFSALYTVLYLRYQRILPEYKFDIHDACVEYLASKTRV